MGGHCSQEGLTGWALLPGETNWVSNAPRRDCMGGKCSHFTEEGVSG